jgi:hypothetical protein
MTARPVDAAVVQAFLEAVSPVGVEVAVRVLSHGEQQLADLRRQWELQLEQARYEARLAQRKYDAVDPDNRGVPAELERRWNAQLTRVAELEQAYAKAEQEASFTLTPEERAAMQTLAGDLSAIWQAETTTSADRKQLLRLATLVGATRWGEPPRLDRSPDPLALGGGDAPGREASQEGRRVLENSRAGCGANARTRRRFELCEDSPKRSRQRAGAQPLGGLLPANMSGIFVGGLAAGVKGLARWETLIKPGNGRNVG